MPDSSQTQQLQWRYLSLLLLFLVFVFHTYPMGLSDYWWHMSNGRWIWENLSIPFTDQFTYSYAKDDDIRRVVILRAYYLGQVSFYAVHSVFGMWGLLFYKAILLTIPYIVLLRYLHYRQVNPIFAVLILCPLPFIIFRLDELRPQIFSFIGAILVFYLIEKTMDRLRDKQALHKYWILLPITLLLWANLHRGFIIGWVILCIYLFFEWAQYYLQKRALAKQQIRQLTILVSVSIVITFLNPNGPDAIIANFVELKGPFMQVIDEFFPLWKYSKLYQAWHIFFGCVAIVVFSAYFLYKSRAKVQASHLVLILGFSYEGFATFRFSHFLGFLLLAIAAPYYQQASQRIIEKHKKTFIGLLVISMGTLATIAVQRTALLKGAMESAYFPDKAAEYVLENRPPKNLFNAFEYGGYFTWALYPHYPIFIDQRNLDYSVYEEYGNVWNGNYSKIFNKYDVNTVVFYIQQPILNRVPGLVQQLLIDQNWQVVFIDRKTLIFVRASANTNLPIYDKNRVRNYVKQRIGTTR